MRVIVTKGLDEQTKQLIAAEEAAGRSFRLISEAFMLTNPFRRDETNFYEAVQGRVENRPLFYQDIPFAAELKVVEEDQVARFYRRGIKVAEVNYLPGRFGQVADVKHYDRLGRIVYSDSYNLRGFLARRQYAGEQGKIYLVEFYDGQGQVAISVRLTQQDGHSVTQWHDERTGQTYPSEKALFAAFVREQLGPNDEVLLAESMADLEI
jgi:hypothetical protein